MLFEHFKKAKGWRGLLGKKTKQKNVENEIREDPVNQVSAKLAYFIKIHMFTC